jgi:hypothetical protein
MNPGGHVYATNCPSILGMSDSLSVIITGLGSDCVGG